MMKIDKNVGQILYEQGMITSEELELALEEQKRTGERLGEILIKRGLVSKTNIGKILEIQIGVPYVDLSTYEISPEVTHILPEEMVRRHEAFPIKKVGSTLYVAMADPFNLSAIEEIKITSGCQVVPLLTTEGEISEAISKYLIKTEIDQAMKEIKVQRMSAAEEVELTFEQVAELAAEDAPIIRLVNSVIANAIHNRASDIHLEPQVPEMRVRYRIDGLLYDFMTIPKNVESSFISRVKLMAGMNIAEHRRPQDGHISIKSGVKEVDLRVSTVSDIRGEKVVMRILDKSSMLLRLEQLGMLPEQQSLFESFLIKPFGMVLVTGPTGSGKTTTLYSALSRLNNPVRNIITIEDPVEYELPGINQIQVNPKAGIDFATGLRTILRQDPDIIMVGEIRDVEAAKIAIEAALTGHIVFSTLHTNDAPSAVARLMEMGVEPFLISSAVIGIVAQRLTRLICLECKQEYEPSPKVVEKLGLQNRGKTSFARGKGCKSCNSIGYRGRIGIFEVMGITPAIMDLILERVPANIIREQTIKEGMRTMRDSGTEKIAQKITTVEEVMRVIYGEQLEV